MYYEVRLYAFRKGWRVYFGAKLSECGLNVMLEAKLAGATRQASASSAWCSSISFFCSSCGTGWNSAKVRLNLARP